MVPAWVDVSNMKTKNKGFKLILVMEILIFIEFRVFYCDMLGDDDDASFDKSLYIVVYV